MANRIIKPDSGNRLVLQDDGGGSALAIETNQDVNITDADLYFGTAGKGVVLGATSNVDANTLDDYEEGTWTAVITDDTNDATMTNTTCLYTKIGRLVTVSGSISCSSLGSVSGDIRIKTLPFTVSNTTGNQSGVAIGFLWNGAIAVNTSVCGYFWQNTTKIYLGLWAATTGARALQGSEFSADGQIIIGGSYMTA
jgi:hypothetical protein